MRNVALTLLAMTTLAVSAHQESEEVAPTTENVQAEVPELTESEQWWLHLLGQRDFKRSGLSKLSSEQAELLRRRVQQHIRWNTPNQNLVGPAMERMLLSGWKKGEISWGRLDGEPALIYDNGVFGRYATSSLPYGVSSTTTPAGTYWVKEQFMGGVSEIADTFGSHSFLFATWVDI